MACNDGTLHCYRTENGEYFVGPLMLKGPAAKLVGRDYLIAVVSMRMEFSLWDFEKRSKILGCDVSHLMPGSFFLQILSVSLFQLCF